MGHRWALAVICLLGLLRGLYWVALWPSPTGDEPAHLAYVESLATGDGIPLTSAASPVTLDSARLYKDNRADDPRSAPIALPPDSSWGVAGLQYEGVHPPLYYAAMVPAYWLGHSLDGVLGALFAVRLATLLLAIAALPALYLLARELLPGRADAWLVAPMLLVTMQLYNGSAALVGNDSIGTTTATLCLLALARCRHGLTTRRAFLFGIAFAATVLSKGTFSSLLPVLALGAAWVLSTTRPDRRTLLKCAGAAALPLGALVIPWLALNVSRYHALSGAAEAGRLVSSVIGVRPQGWAGVNQLMHDVTSTLFANEALTATTSRYRLLWGVFGALAIIGGIAAAAARRQRDALLMQLGLGLSLPTGLLLLCVVVARETESGIVVHGRHTAMLLPIFCIAVAHGAALIFGRLSCIPVVAGVAILATVEVSSMRGYAYNTYVRDVVDTSVPVVEQSYRDAQALVTGYVVRPPCLATHLEVITIDAAPALQVDGRPATVIPGGSPWTIYQLPAPTSTPFTATFSKPTLTGVAATLDPSVVPEVQTIGRSRPTPSVRVMCPVDDPAGTRFEQTYDPEHPLGLTLRIAQRWPLVNAALTAATALAGAMLLTRRRGQGT